MEIDASNAGVELGGLVSTDEIKIMICYLLNAINEPVPGQQLSELLHYEGIANYFEVSSAFASLSDKGLINKVEGSTDNYVISEKGKNIAVTLKTSVPYTIRQKAHSIAVKLLTKIKYDNETKIDITPAQNGYTVRCAVMEQDTELMAVSLFVTDEAQAHSIKTLFLEDPSRVYSGLVELLIGSDLK